MFIFLGIEAKKFQKVGTFIQKFDHIWSSSKVNIDRVIDSRKLVKIVSSKESEINQIRLPYIYKVLPGRSSPH